MNRAEIVVVGACVGANVAFRLAREGARVTVLDAGAPGGGTSAASFAWINYVVVSHCGVTLAPVWGRVAAAELLDGKADPRLDSYRPGRFL